MYVVRDSGACLLGLSHCGSCCGPPTAFPLGHRCTVGVLAGTHRCALMPRAASRQSANPLWLLECGLVNVSWCSSKHAQRGFTALLFYEFRVTCLTTILDSRSLECENTYTLWSVFQDGSNETIKNASTWRHLHFERTQSFRGTA